MGVVVGEVSAKKAAGTETFFVGDAGELSGFEDTSPVTKAAGNETFFVGDAGELSGLEDTSPVTKAAGRVTFRLRLLASWGSICTQDSFLFLTRKNWDRKNCANSKVDSGSEGGKKRVGKMQRSPRPLLCIFLSFRFSLLFFCTFVFLISFKTLVYSL